MVKVVVDLTEQQNKNIRRYMADYDMPNKESVILKIINNFMNITEDMEE